MLLLNPKILFQAPQVWIEEQKRKFHKGLFPTFYSTQAKVKGQGCYRLGKRFVFFFCVQCRKSCTDFKDWNKYMYIRMVLMFHAIRMDSTCS